MRGIIRVGDVHQHLQMGPAQFSPQCGENWFIREHLGRADAVAQLLLAPTTAVLSSQLSCERGEDLLSVARALPAQHIISNATTNLPIK